MEPEKMAVRDFWDAAACGEVYAQGATVAEKFAAQAEARYRLEPYLRPFARFDGTGRDVLEIGVGMGADHLEWARSGPRRLAGVDLTPRAVEWTRQRLALEGFDSDLAVGDAENLDFPDNSFDIVYSWGVLHHSPDTEAAFNEVHRVLRPGGIARLMIYHRPSWVGLMLWARYGLAKGKPTAPMTAIYRDHLESPGTKGFTTKEARALAGRFSDVTTRTVVSLGDLLEGDVGQNHPGRTVALAKKLWPRALVRRVPSLGLFLLIEAVK